MGEEGGKGVGEQEEGQDTCFFGWLSSVFSASLIFFSFIHFEHQSLFTARPRDDQVNDGCL